MMGPSCPATLLVRPIGYLKSRLEKERSQTVTNCNRLKMIAEDGKMCLTDAADPEMLLRIIQSVPSPSAEPRDQDDAGHAHEECTASNIQFQLLACDRVEGGQAGP